MTTLPINLQGNNGSIVDWLAKASKGFGSVTLPARPQTSRSSNHVQTNRSDAATNMATDAAELDSLSDEALLVDYREGNRDAFVTLLERYRNDLSHFLYRFLGSRAAADDVFQETFLQVHLAADSFDADRRFKPWLYTIAANKARDHHRRRRRRSAVSLSTPVGDSDGRDAQMIDLLQGDPTEPDQDLLREELQGTVKQVVDGMPAHYREILLLSYFQRLSYNQISETLSIPLGTVKSRLHAAVANFADAWQAASPNSDGDGNPTKTTTDKN